MDITIEDLFFKYTGKDCCVLNGFNLEVLRGDRVSILGPSGCGKTTLLRLVAGLLPSNGDMLQGEVMVNGISLVHEKAEWQKFVRSGALGYVFQQPTLFPNLTVRENIALPLKMIGGETSKPMVDSLLDMVGLAHCADQLPSALSGGMQTRVALARAFATRPKILLLDEPFNGLDVGWKSRLYRDASKLCEQYNASLVLVTHDIYEAIRFSDVLCVLNCRAEAVTLKIPDWNNDLHLAESVTKHRDIYEQIHGIMEYE